MKSLYKIATSAIVVAATGLVSMAPAASAASTGASGAEGLKFIRITRVVKPVQNIQDVSNCGNTVKSPLKFTVTGLDASTSDRVLAVLKKRGVRAIIFATGTYVKENPDDVRAFLAAGSIFGSYGATDAVFDTSKRSNYSIQQWMLNGALGPRRANWYYRPQTEAQLFDARMIAAVNAAGARVCGYNVDTSAISGSPAQVVKKVFTGSSVNQSLRRSHVITFDGRDPNTPAILDGVIRGAKARGWAIARTL